ncbi:MAG TPA: hypothetical protein PLE24_06380, partial [Chitinispirillaceae bacterium]|nr:hypothetical protein [Chitinispirillaceae bacterium]
QTEENCLVTCPFFRGNSSGSRSSDNHYLIYLDPQLPQGFLSPFKLKVEGEVSTASWVTKPEALVLYIDGKLCVYDLSRFSPEKKD